MSNLKEETKRIVLAQTTCLSVSNWLWMVLKSSRAVVFLTHMTLGKTSNTEKWFVFSSDLLGIIWVVWFLHSSLLIVCNAGGQVAEAYCAVAIIISCSE